MLRIVCHAVVTMAIVSAPFGCDQRPTLEGRVGQAPADQVPPLTSIRGSTSETGFATGMLRAQRVLSSYKITKHPITRDQYAACVQAGGCPHPEGAACADSAYAPYGSGYVLPNYAQGPAQAPAICVGETQAEAYCAWLGGHVPNLDQWLFAARGNAPRRYAWGDAPASCDQHLLAPQVLSRLREKAIAQALPETPPECPVRAFDGTELAVATHHAGASPSGMEDVLLAPGELLASNPESVFNACGGNGTHCVVFGLEPAAIDSVEPFFTVPEPASGTKSPSASSVAHAYAFRCVLETQR
jgi:hypothetical protein